MHRHMTKSQRPQQVASRASGAVQPLMILLTRPSELHPGAVEAGGRNLPPASDDADQCFCGGVTFETRVGVRAGGVAVQLFLHWNHLGMHIC